MDAVQNQPAQIIKLFVLEARENTEPIFYVFCITPHLFNFRYEVNQPTLRSSYSISGNLEKLISDFYHF